MESKTSIHSSHSSHEAGHNYQEAVFNEKKAGIYDDEDVVGTKNEFHDEDSPIEEVRAVVPK
jgi:hypothetical protein